MSRSSRQQRWSLAHIAGIIAVTGATLAAAPDANAQFISRFALRGEFGAGTMLSEHQRTVLLDDGVGIQATGRLGFTIVDPLVIQIGVANWFFPHGDGSTMGRVIAPTGGLRVEPRIGSVGRLFIEANAGLAITGDDQRFYFDAGLGFEFALSRAIGLGPALRYGHVVQRSTTDNGSPEPYPDDAQFWSAGLSISLRVPPDEAVADRDGDGVHDPDDQCIDVPQGANPDPNRRGCPLADRDSDGVMDPDDQCPDQPQGATPDPNRHGCPLADRDSDGVMDPDDQCPDQPQGANPDPTRRGCPRGDRDNDGVFDDEDQCIDTPAGNRPSTARRGCPAVDQDHDGILDPPDGPDRCPTEPETYNGNQDDDGCPDGQALAQQTGNQIQILDQVNFRTNRDEIQGRRSFQVLDSVVAILRAMTQITQVDIQGHTDDRGSADRNRELSNSRAIAVRAYLVQHGVDESRLVAHGFGPDCPLQPGRSRAARAANRRVQFVIVSPETPAGQCANSNATPTATTNAAPEAAPARAGRHHRGRSGRSGGSGHHRTRRRH